MGGFLKKITVLGVDPWLSLKSTQPAGGCHPVPWPIFKIDLFSYLETRRIFRGVGVLILRSARVRAFVANFAQSNAGVFA